MSADRDEATNASPARPLRGARLLRATRVAGGLTLALVLLHYAGAIGTPPPPLPQLGLYLLAGASGGALFGLADWLRHRARGARDGDPGRA